MARPSRSEALSDPAKLRELVKFLCSEDSSITQAQLASRIGVSAPAFSRKLAGQKEKFNPTQIRLLVDLIFFNLKTTLNYREKFESISMDFFYFAFLEFLDLNKFSQDQIRDSLNGTYELWRFSVEHDDEFVHGKMCFYCDPDTDCVKVDMFQPKKNRRGVRESSEVYRGYAIDISGIIIAFLKNESSNEIRITFFYRHRFEWVACSVDGSSKENRVIGKIIHMDGFNLGIDGRSVFFSPVFLQIPADDTASEDFDESLDVVEESVVPDRIVKRLKKFARFLR